MIYNDRLGPPTTWATFVRQPSSTSKQRSWAIFLLIAATIILTLSVAALIVVFAVENAWFHDNFENSLTRYGLWRLCFASLGCHSWFSTSGDASKSIERRLDQSRAGINAWQALEIIFLFLTTSTVIIALLALITYRNRRYLHFYLAILAPFCGWPGVLIGISALFVFGFAVFNVSTTPRDLDWCFYVNLVAVILSLIGMILLSLYSALLKRPHKNVDDEVVVESFPDLETYPTAMSPSTFVIVRRNKKKRSKPYDYPQVLYPETTYPQTTSIENRTVTTNTNQTVLTPYNSIGNVQEANTKIRDSPSIPQRVQTTVTNRTIEYNNHSDLVPSSSFNAMGHQPQTSMQTNHYRATIASPRPPYEISSSVNWRRMDSGGFNPSTSYHAEPMSNDYFQNDVYYPSRSNTFNRLDERRSEPRILHYYTGLDYFATVDPSDTALVRHHSSNSVMGPTIRYNTNPAYYSSGDYLKSSM